MDAIQIENLSFSYGDKIVLDHFSLELPLDGLTALSGPSGCGKTTLLHLMAGLETASSGTITGLNPQQTAILFQEDRLLPWCTVCEHILEVLPASDNLRMNGQQEEHQKAKGKRQATAGVVPMERFLSCTRTPGYKQAWKEAEIYRWLSFVELEKEANAYPDSLSGGMARRLALARCCALGGEVLLLDEPFTGVDAECRARILERLKNLDLPVLMATHEQDVIEACRHVIHLQGPPLCCCESSR